jgi:hypothetical protein
MTVARAPGEGLAGGSRTSVGDPWPSVARG